MKGLKLVSAATGKQIADARVIQYDQENVVIDFRPVAGAGSSPWSVYRPVPFIT